jgi:hypothetical protein
LLLLVAIQLIPKFGRILVGDNEWNDCRNPTDALSYWKSEFLEFDRKYWKNHTFQVRRQVNRTENFSFIHKGTLFIGLNLVGGPVFNRTSWNQRLIEQYNWTVEMIQLYIRIKIPSNSIGRVVIFGHANPTRNHLKFFEPLSVYIRNELKNRIPILYMHGDKHTWIYEPNYMNQSSMLRISLVGLAKEPPIKVMVYATGSSAKTDEAFAYDRRL